ncbi:protein lifeguard 2 [Scaptodrosophila lebanonensis]|uniref:Protein lifeguard 2 n=1 Tax=Drosophila lebanonensis TaxID=7225 RepID=A0A6J2U2C8_DROLE|nr:protein lifeguard 2 [Scaptodrosophila lebanonensis]
MSYSRMTDSENKLEMPIHKQENFPQIPPVEQSSTSLGSQMGPPMLYVNQIVIHNSPGILIAQPDDELKNIIFNDQTIRKGFIRKVYLIVMTQLIFTCGIIALFVYHKPTKLFVQQNPVVLVVAIVINIIVMLSMACCETARRTFPVNFVCLGFFTVTMSLLLGAISSQMDADVVLLAVGITALLVAALSVYAIQTKYDFTTWGGVLVCCLMCLIIFGMMAIFWLDTFLYTVHSCVGALLASFLLIYDTQLIMGGNHRYQFSPEEYIFAALTLYVDVVRIFLYVLRLLRR